MCWLAWQRREEKFEASRDTCWMCTREAKKWREEMEERENNGARSERGRRSVWKDQKNDSSFFIPFLLIIFLSQPSLVCRLYFTRLLMCVSSTKKKTTKWKFKETLKILESLFYSLTRAPHLGSEWWDVAGLSLREQEREENDTFNLNSLCCKVKFYSIKIHREFFFFFISFFHQLQALHARSYSNEERRVSRVPQKEHFAEEKKWNADFHDILLNMLCVCLLPYRKKETTYLIR